MEKQVLTQEELEGLNEIQLKAQNIALELGEISMIEIQLEKRKENIKKELEEANKVEQEFTNNLKNKYGDVSINVKTGEINKI